MAKKPDITTIASGYYSRQALNNNFENLQDGFDNTLSLDGSTPNAMGADLDLNANDLLNARTLNADEPYDRRNACTCRLLLALQLQGQLCHPSDSHR